jgi:hypothetical protein
MQVNRSKQVMMKYGGLSRSRPVKANPAESNLVKPFNDETQAGK